MARYKEEKEEHIMYVLKDTKNNKVWHEQFYTWIDAKRCIDSYAEKGIIGNWEIETVYPKNNI